MLYAYRLGVSKDVPAWAHKVDASSPRYLYLWSAFVDLIPNIGWDGTYNNKKLWWSIPMPKTGGLLGVGLQQTTTGDIFIGSPIEFTYLNDLIDYDARTDSEEIQRVRAAMEDDVTSFPHRAKALWASLSQPTVAPWGRSPKGNPTTKIGRSSVCVFPEQGRGYVGVIFGAGGTKIYTPVQKSEEGAMKYLETHFNRLIKQWTDEPDDTDDDEGDHTIILPR